MSDMATLSVRLSDDEFAALTADAQRAGVSVSSWVRDQLGLTRGRDDEWREELERRVSRLEEMAGL